MLLDQPGALVYRPTRKTMDVLKAGAMEWGLKLTPPQVDAFGVYYQQLLIWNERISLTSITDYEEVQVKHFLDSLSCLQVLDTIAPDARCIDIGAGAGLPGLPLKIVRPRLRLTLLESVGKKARFLAHVVEAMGLQETDVVQGRAEELGRDPEYREAFDVALARAVAQMSVLVEYALPLVRVGGVFVAQKGDDIEVEVEAAGAAMEILGGRLREIRAVDLPGAESARHLVVVQKVSPTTERYPRRPGIPAKRPLIRH
jgi:16S rRNA (guanine527-N7)-methyltransferase